METNHYKFIAYPRPRPWDTLQNTPQFVEYFAVCPSIFHFEYEVGNPNHMMKRKSINGNHRIIINDIQGGSNIIISYFQIPVFVQGFLG